MGSFDRTVLIFEWLTGGGCWIDDANPTSCCLLNQGREMLRSVTQDFHQSGFDVCSVVDSRLEISTPGRQFHFGEDSCLKSSLRQWVSEVDLAMVIAPESDGCLQQCLGWMVGMEQKWLNPDLEFTSLAANKNRLQEFLASHQIPIPDGVGGHLFTQGFIGGKSQLVIKPADGCGGEENLRVDSAELHQPQFASYFSAGYRIEEWIPGVATSVGIVGNGRGNRAILRPQQQHFDQGDAGVFSHCSNDLTAQQSHRTYSLAEKLLPILPDFKGYIGVDCVIGQRDVVIEINPRATVSFASGSSPATWFAKNCFR